MKEGGWLVGFVPWLRFITGLHKNINSVTLNQIIMCEWLHQGDGLAVNKSE